MLSAAQWRFSSASGSRKSSRGLSNTSEPASMSWSACFLRVHAASGVKSKYEGDSDLPQGSGSEIGFRKVSLKCPIRPNAIGCGNLRFGKSPLFPIRSDASR
jgi:hypothetical protein